MNRELLIIVGVLIILIVFFIDQKGENFSDTYHESSLDYDMDRIKDQKGRTLDDYILANSILTGQNIVSPF